MTIPTGWTKGDSTGMTCVACCPECGETANQRHRGKRARDQRVTWFECMHGCGRYKMEAKKASKALVIAFA